MKLPVILYLAPLLCLAVSAKPDPEPNILERIYSIIGKDTYTVDSFENLRARDLLRYGVINIKSESSLIVSDYLAEETFNQNYVPTYNFEPSEDNYDASEAFARISDTNDERWYSFHQYDYSKMAAKKSYSEWTPVSSCMNNEWSETVSTYGESWLFKIIHALSAGVRFTQLVGFGPRVGAEVLLRNTVGGAYSCDVAPGKKLQFQAKFEVVEISGMRSRRLKVEGDHRYTSGYMARMEAAEWEEVDPYRQVNEGNIQTACVTDPSMLMCGEKS